MSAPMTKSQMAFELGPGVALEAIVGQKRANLALEEFEILARRFVGARPAR